ncbi:dihydropteroate synthase [bacterium]|nr:dihydropteroate synthase [bacterium]
MKIGNKTFDFRTPIIMGILNVTPDSFSDGGKYSNQTLAVKHAIRMISDGADIIDIGGESSRPGSDQVDADEEIARTIPIIREIRAKSDSPISIDTMKSQVAKAALEAGADMINDVSGLRHDKDMVRLVAESNVPVCIMHMLGTPKTMQEKVFYKDVIEDIYNFFTKAIDNAVNAGVKKEKIILDPGIGFGKNLEHNLKILNHLDRFKDLGLPILIGPSRKFFIGAILDLPANERIEGTLASLAVAIERGADILRVHDVLQVSRFKRVFEEIRQNSPNLDPFDCVQAPP